MDLHVFSVFGCHPYVIRSQVFVRLKKWWISGVFTQGTGFKLRNETDKYGSSYNMLEDMLAGENVGHEIGPKKDTIVK